MEAEQLVAARNQTASGSGLSDAALVVAARAGEAWAQEALFLRYARMMNGMAFRLMGRDADVDDLVQESFTRALENLNKLREPQAFGAWLGSIVVRTARKTLRRRSLLYRLGLAGKPEIALDAVVSPAAPADVASELRAVYGILGGLAPEVRIAIVLRRVEGLSIDEVAERMQLSPATVKRRIAAADHALAEALPEAS